MEGQQLQGSASGGASGSGSQSKRQSIESKGKGRMRDLKHSEMTPEAALMQEIDSKKAQIVQGFPLASMTGVSDVASHLSLLTAAPHSSFRSTSGGTPTFAQDPLFSQYAREMETLMGSSKRPSDPTVSKQDFESIKASASSTFGRAMIDNSRDMDGLWKDYPYPLSASSTSGKPYQPTHLKHLNRADPAMSSSLANEILNKHDYPYPTPASSSKATLGPLPNLIYDASNPPKKSTLTVGQKKRIQDSKAFLKNHIQESLVSKSPDVKKARSPIPLLPSATPKKAAPPSAIASSSSTALPPPSAKPNRLSVPVAASPLKQVFNNTFPSPMSQATSSPDPMALIAPAYRPKQHSHSHRPSLSTSHIVVEVPVSSKKRYSSEDSNPALPAKKRVKMVASDGKPVKAFSKTSASGNKHGPFSELTSEMEEQGSEMDVDAPFVSSSSPAVSKSVNSSATTIRIKPSGSNKKVAKVVSGEKEAETLLEKFTDLLEEIFEADDALVPSSGMAVDDESDEDEEDEGRKQANKVFNRGQGTSLASSSSQNTLRPEMMRKVVKAINALVKVPGGRKAVEEQVEASQLSRLLKIVERSIAKAEDLQVIPEVTDGRAISTSASPKKATQKGGKKAKKIRSESPTVTATGKGGTRRRSSRSATPASYDEEEEEEHELASEKEDEEYATSQQSSPVKGDGASKKGRKSTTTKSKKGMDKHADKEGETQLQWSRDTLDELGENLEILQNAVLAIETCMTVLTSGRLSKQIYSEDLINSCLNTLKHQLATVVYPALDTDNSPLAVPLTDARFSNAIVGLLKTAAAVLPKIASLIKEEEMPETIIINAVYVAVAPFFAEQGVKTRIKGDGLGIAEMKLIRNQALGLIRIIFARYTEQRQWIIEEVLGSITKLPDLAKRKPQYLLQSGQAVQTVSVLLLHLVQSCTSGVREKMAAAVRETGQEDEKDDGEAAHMDAAQKLVEPSFGAATRCGTAIIGYLIQRSGKAPKNSTASEAEYKAVLDHLVKDLLVVVDHPEWPVATLMLQIAMKAMMGVLDDPKVSADVNTSKGICLELLGYVGSRIHQLSKAAQPDEAEEEAKAVMSISQAVRNQDRKGLKQLGQAKENMTQLLLQSSSDDGAMETAADYASARWSMDLLQATRILPNIQREEEVKPKFERELYKRHGSLWEPQQQTSAFQSSSSDYRATLADAHRILFPAHGLPPAMDALLNHILNACEGAVIAFRQKALKALGAIVEQDSSIFFQQNVRLAVEKRLMDSSPAVRDAALEMLGRYVVYNPDLAVQYLVRIGERITDSGLSVRKRVIKLLKSIYPVIEDRAYQIDICRRLVGRVNDEDDGVKDLAASAVEDLWFTTKAASGRKSSTTGDREPSPAKKRETLAKSSVMMAVAGIYRERPSPLEEMVKMIIDKYTNAKTTKSKESLANLTGNLRDIVEALVDALIDAGEGSDFNVVNCIKTIYILLLADASMLSVSRASLLLPYMRGASTPEEQVIAEYLLKIFTSVLPHMPPSANKFANDLQETLRSLLNKPTAIGPQALPDLVSCFCAVVVNQTYLYNKLCDVFKACYTRLQQGVRRLVNQDRPLAPEEKAQLLRNMPVLARMVSLFCQYADFDRLRASSPDARPYIDTISKDSIRDEVYFQMIQVYQLSAGTTLHGTALQCLGFLYRAHPRYMTEEASTTIMDKIFTSGTAEARALLLRTICEFLVSQSAKLTDEDKDDEIDDVDMRQLVGNTENFADSGVSSAVVQRYQAHLLEAAVDPGNPPAVTRPALDIVAFTVKQGLAHPMQCLPVLVALETSEDANVVQKVFSLHSLLHNKHSALINTRIGESIQAAFQYQNKAKQSQHIRGYQGDPPAAQLSRWYALMREKRQWRLDFLKSFARGLHTEAADTACDQQTVNFARFTAENLATFDYKTQEEVFFVVRSTTIILSVTGMQIYHHLQDDGEQQAEGTETRDMPSLLRKSTILAFAFCLRNHLKALYGVTEQKLAKYTTGKKSAAGDKPAAAKSGVSRVITYPDMPFVANSMESEDDFEKQRSAYIRMIDSDGTIREAQNDEEDTE